MYKVSAGNHKRAHDQRNQRLKLGFLLPAFPRKGRELDRHFVYLGEEKRLRTHNTDASALRADEAILFLHAVPEVLVMSEEVAERQFQAPSVTATNPGPRSGPKKRFSKSGASPGRPQHGEPMTETLQCSATRRRLNKKTTMAASLIPWDAVP